MTRFGMGATGKVLVGLAAASLALAACSSSSTPEGDSTASAIPAPSVDAALAAMVPDSVKSTGKMLFGTDASYPPNEFIEADGSTITGFDVDLGKAIAAKLGLTGEFQNASFGTIIVGVVNGKFNAGISSFTINAERMQEVNMVSYFAAGTSWGTQAGNPKGVSPDNACGFVIAVQKATVQLDDLEARNKECTDAGKPAINIQQYELQTDAAAAVVSTKADAFLADSPVVSYAIQQSNGKMEPIGELYDSAPYGVVIAKDELEFAKAVQGAIDALIKDGTYLQILEKWGLQDGAITASELNPSS